MSFPQIMYTTQINGKFTASDTKEELVGYDDQQYTVGVYKLVKKITLRREMILTEEDA